MNISQIARNQQMLYQFVNKNSGSDYKAKMQMQSKLASMGGFTVTGKGEDMLSSMLKSMGISGVQGGTFREMAKYQIRVQNASEKEAAQKAQDTQKTDSAAPKQGFSIREQYTQISDKATESMQKLALEDAKKSAEGKKGASSTERAKLIQEHLKDVEPSKRSAAFNTMNKVWESETERLGKYIKEKTPGWNDWGDKFDTSILDDYKPGVNVWV